MQLLFSSEYDKRVEKTLIMIQTLACQLSSTLMQLLFSSEYDKRVEKTLIMIQTLACQLSSTLMQLLFSFDQDMRVEKTFMILYGVWPYAHLNNIHCMFTYTSMYCTDFSLGNCTYIQVYLHAHDYPLYSLGSSLYDFEQRRHVTGLDGLSTR